MSVTQIRASRSVLKICENVTKSNAENQMSVTQIHGSRFVING